MEKKEWSDPELIVLVRSKPEEAVLDACKISNWPGPVSELGSCAGGGPVLCLICFKSVAS